MKDQLSDYTHCLFISRVKDQKPKTAWEAANNSVRVKLQEVTTEYNNSTYRDKVTERGLYTERDGISSETGLPV